MPKPTRSINAVACVSIRIIIEVINGGISLGVCLALMKRKDVKTSSGAARAYGDALLTPSRKYAGLNAIKKEAIIEYFVLFVNVFTR